MSDPTPATDEEIERARESFRYLSGELSGVAAIGVTLIARIKAEVEGRAAEKDRADRAEAERDEAQMEFADCLRERDALLARLDEARRHDLRTHACSHVDNALTQEAPDE